MHLNRTTQLQALDFRVNLDNVAVIQNKVYPNLLGTKRQPLCPNHRKHKISTATPCGCS